MPAEALRSFGLTDNESRAYLALLRYGRQTPAELAPRAGVSRGRVYQVLGEMCRKGVAVERSGHPRAFEAVPARLALGGLVERRRNEVARTESLLEEVCGRLDDLALPTAGSLPAFEVLASTEQLSLRFDQLQREARTEILLINKAPYLDPEDNPGERDALARGVTVRCLYERVSLEDPIWVADIAAFVAAGERARIVAAAPLKMAVFDRRLALLPLASSADPALPYTPVVAHDPGLVQVLSLGFEHLWSQGEPFVPVGVKPPVPSREVSRPTGMI